MTPAAQQLPRFRRPTDQRARGGASGCCCSRCCSPRRGIPSRTVSCRVASFGRTRLSAFSRRDRGRGPPANYRGAALQPASWRCSWSRRRSSTWSMPRPRRCSAAISTSTGIYRICRHFSASPARRPVFGGWPVRSLFLAAIILLPIAGTIWIWRQVLPALADRRIALGVAVLLGVALDVTAFMPAEERPLATGFGLDIVRQAVALVRAGARRARAGPMPRRSRRRRRRAATSPGSNGATSISSTSNPTAPRSSTRRSSAQAQRVAGPIRNLAARRRLHDRFEPAGLPNLWRRLVARPCDPRKRGPAR